MDSPSTSFRASKLEAWELDAAKNLKVLFDKKVRTTQKSFGREFGIGTGGMVSQYLNAKRPLGLSAAIKFAKGLDVDLFEISPQLAAQLPPGSRQENSNHHLAQEARPSYKNNSLGQTLADLSNHLQVMDEGTRRMAMGLIAELANDPGRHATVTAMIELSIRSLQKRAA